MCQVLPFILSTFNYYSIPPTPSLHLTVLIRDPFLSPFVSQSFTASLFTTREMCLASRTITGSQTALASDPTSKQWKDFAAKEFMETKTRLTPITDTNTSPPLSPSHTTKLAVRSHDDNDTHIAPVVSSPKPDSPWLAFAAHNHETLPSSQLNHYDTLRSKSPPSLPTLKRSISDKAGQQRGDMVGMQQEHLQLYTPQLATDPPRCFCNEPAHIRNTSDYGIVYECYRVTASSDRNVPVCCTFHVHKDTWSFFQHALQNGRHIDPNHPDLQQCSAFNYTFRAIFRTENTFPMRLSANPLCYCNHFVRPVQDYHRSNNRMALVCPKMTSEELRYKACQWFLWAEDARALQSTLTHPTSLSNTISSHHENISSNTTTISTSSIDSKKKDDHNDTSDNDNNRTTNDETSSIASAGQHLKHTNNFHRDSGLMTAPSSPNTLDAKSTATSEDASIYKTTPVHMLQPSPKQLLPDTDKSLELIRLLKGAKVPEWYSDDQHHHHDTSFHGDTASLDSDDHSSTQSTVPGSPSSPFKVSMPVPASVYTRLLMDKKKSEYDGEQVSMLNQHALMMENELKRFEDENQQVKTIYAAKEEELNSLLRANDEDLAEIDRWEYQIKELAKLDTAMELLWDQTCDMAEEEIANVRKAKQCEITLTKLTRDLLDRLEQLKSQIAKKEDLDERTSLRDFKCRVCFQENIQVALVPCFHCCKFLTSCKI